MTIDWIYHNEMSFILHINHVLLPNSNSNLEIHVGWPCNGFASSNAVNLDLILQKCAIFGRFPLGSSINEKIRYFLNNNCNREDKPWSEKKICSCLGNFWTKQLTDKPVQLHSAAQSENANSEKARKRSKERAPHSTRNHPRGGTLFVRVDTWEWSGA